MGEKIEQRGATQSARFVRGPLDGAVMDVPFNLKTGMPVETYTHSERSLLCRYHYRRTPEGYYLFDGWEETG